MTWTHLYNIMSEKNCEGRGMGRQQERLWQVGTSLVPCGFSLRLVEVGCLCKMAPRSPLPCPWWSNWKSGCSGRHTEHFLIGKNLDEGQGWMFEKFFFPRGNLSSILLGHFGSHKLFWEPANTLQPWPPNGHRHSLAHTCTHTRNLFQNFPWDW